jgi:hypothetical protein
MNVKEFVRLWWNYIWIVVAVALVAYWALFEYRTDYTYLAARQCCPCLNLTIP